MFTPFNADKKVASLRSLTVSGVHCIVVKDINSLFRVIAFKDCAHQYIFMYAHKPSYVETQFLRRLLKTTNKIY